MTRAELLADHFIRCAGIATVYVDAGGIIGTIDGAGIACPPGGSCFAAHTAVTPRSLRLQPPARSQPKPGRPARGRPSMRPRPNSG
jgi:hypothetical protein